MLSLRWAFLLVALLSVGVGGLAQTQVQKLTQVQGSEEAVGVRAASAADYRAQVERLQALVSACRKDAAACDAKLVGDDERIEEGGFEARWNWLREALASAHDAGLPGRERLLQAADARLAADVALAAGTGAEQGDGFARARTGVDRILARPEFRTVTEASYLERQMAAVAAWLDRLFSGVSRFGKRSPWVVPAIEWGAIGLAAAGLLIWVWRTMQRQRLAIRVESSAGAEVWRKEADNWAELARVEAERKDWREAVHCLYWATIVMMEGRKVWRQNRARTPREYLALLEPGSAMQQALRGLTQIFERIWYGLRPAGESDYERARVLFEELRAA